MKLTILETSDTHGYIFPTNYQSRTELDGKFSLLRAKTFFDEVYEKNGRDAVLAVENGDTLQGSAFASYMTKERSPEHTVMFQKAYNALDYDFGVLGNHDFNYGQELLQATFAAANRQLLNANIIDQTTGEPFMGQAVAIVEKNGLKIAVIGVTTKYIPHWEDPVNIKNLEFLDVVETLKKVVAEVREKVDLVVVSYHGGFERDLETGEPTERITGENQGYAILEEVQGIDVLLTGHQHREMATTKNGVAIVQPGYQAKYVGVVEVEYEYDKVTGKNIIQEVTPKIVATGDFEPNKELHAELSPMNEQVIDWLDRPVGSLDRPLLFENGSKARIEDHPYLNFVHQVQLAKTGADISAATIIKEEAPGLPQQVSKRDLLLNYPYSNQLVTVEITGAQLRSILEYTATFFVRNEKTGAIEFAERFLKPKYQLYHFDSFYPVNYQIEVDQPLGARVTELSFEGEPVQDEQKFSLAVSKYRAMGGGTYPVYPELTVTKEYDSEITEIMEDYLRENSTVVVDHRKNYKIK